ncbi:TPA: hypothetical protein N0F65_002720 [Lagenidium giganteum]|uniref:Integrase catalytic domain-containing protein n=1 Tax=Lagenidium giganteum TaxID=4803 RepID=A0AAV2Z4X0_9STRA|nr:TPA: hypothetical protein N0F65_002720 [Lagenidium giganteum]
MGLQQIDHLETGTEMWSAICEIYEKRMDPMIRESVILRKSDELRELKCAAGSDVNIHLSKMFRIRTELASYGYEVNAINMKQMMLDSLPDLYEFEQLRGAVKYGGNGASITPEALRVMVEQAAERQSRRRKGNLGGNNPGEQRKREKSDGQAKPKTGGEARPKRERTLAISKPTAQRFSTEFQAQAPAGMDMVGDTSAQTTPEGRKMVVPAPNQLVYADLLFPPQHNVMDAWIKYVTAYSLKDKSGATVNEYMQRYVMWAERQAGRGVVKIIQREHEPAESTRFPVQRVLTDKGGEFVNKDMKEWYAARGIQHIKVGPKSSHLNPCERAHQSLNDYVKTQMHRSGYPKSFWWYAFLNGVYIKNRVYNRSIGGIPFQRMVGVVPNVHHLRPIGSLAFVQVPNSPERKKTNDNAIVGFLLDYAEDTVGVRVYIPSENLVKFVSEVRVVEDVTYGDRYNVDAASRDSATPQNQSLWSPVTARWTEV